MWYPSQLQLQQPIWYGYVNHFANQQQSQTRTSYYFNGDELSSTCNVPPINNENESLVHCQTNYSGNNHGKKKT